MIETIERKMCDVCKREVKGFAGSLLLEYAETDYTGCGFPEKVERKEICIDCCRKLHTAIDVVLSEVEK